MTRVKAILIGILVAGTVAGCMPQAAVNADRFLVYFVDVSTAITPQAAAVIADAVAKFRVSQARSLRIEGRASATGTPAANQKLSEARVQAVADELQKDGLDPKTFHQVYVGETGSGDPSVAERRVDIILEH